MKALIHVNEKHKWQTALSNLKNLSKAEMIKDIVLLINGEAVELILDTKNLDEILNELEVFVCNNSLAQRSIEPKTLDPVFIVVPSGVVKIVELQEENYRYIKP